MRRIGITTLEARREYLKDKRFVVEYFRSGEAGESWIRYRAGDFTDAHWRSFCLEHGEDPGQDSIDVPSDLLVPGGVSQAPPEPLTRLIGAYILADLPVEALLRKLHDEPETVNLEQLDLHINGKKSKDGKVPGLKTRASDVARLVRGGGLTRGRTTGNLSPTEEDAAAYIQLQRQRGASDEQILQELREGHGLTQRKQFGEVCEALTWPDITMDDLQRLATLEVYPNALPDEA